MTFLEIVNAVNRRLREREVSSWNETTYSTMVGDFVNDAKFYVESCWDWSGNRQVIDVATSDGTDLYPLVSFNQDGKLLSAYNDTDNFELRLISQGEMDAKNYTGEQATGSPKYYCFRGVDSNDDSQIELYPVPNGVYNLRFNSVVKQRDFDDDADVLNIPARPVILRAVAMLAEERGEFAGIPNGRYYQMADAALRDAIGFDSAKNPSELVWYTPGNIRVRR